MVNITSFSNKKIKKWPQNIQWTMTLNVLIVQKMQIICLPFNHICILVASQYSYIYVNVKLKFHLMTLPLFFCLFGQFTSIQFATPENWFYYVHNTTFTTILILENSVKKIRTVVGGDCKQCILSKSIFGQIRFRL